MENLLECNVCLEKYNNKEKIPRILKCGHTFCSKCLKELTRVNSNMEMSFPFVKCPLDKTIGHTNSNIEEIPINRIIVDMLDFSGFQFEKLTLNGERHFVYINSAAEKLKELDKRYTKSYNIIKENLMNLTAVKNNCISSISDHYDKILNIIENQKSKLIIQIEKYTKDKINNLNDALHALEKFREEIQFKLERLEIVKNQKIMSNNITMSDEINLVSNLGIDQLENTEFQRDIDKILSELQGEFLPKVIFKEEVDEALLELIDSLKLILPFKDPFDIYMINDLENLNIHQNLYWFQQNTKNVYRKSLNESDWLLVDNKENFIFKEMFRVCTLGPDEVLLTGGGQGFISSSVTIHFLNGVFKRMQNMMTERKSHSTCKVGEFVYVCGGTNSKGEPLISCEKFSLGNEKWFKVSNMKIAKSHLSICNFNDQYIYSIGGENNSMSLLDTIERYTVTLDLWECMNTRLPNKIECVACIQIKNEILIMGGYSCELGSLKSVHCYNTDTNTIRYLIKELSQPGWSIYNPIRQDNSIHLFYGGEEGYPPHHLVYEFNENNNY